MNKKVTIVTGGTKGIGEKIVEHCLKKKHKVAFCSSSNFVPDIKFKQFENSYLYRKIDVCNEKEVKKFINLIVKKFKKIDYLINNAGTYGDIGNFEKSNLKNWKKAVEVNLFGSINLIKHCLPILKRKKSISQKLSNFLVEGQQI